MTKGLLLIGGEIFSHNVAEPYGAGGLAVLFIRSSFETSSELVGSNNYFKFKNIFKHFSSVKNPELRLGL